MAVKAGLAILLVGVAGLAVMSRFEAEKSLANGGGPGPGQVSKSYVPEPSKTGFGTAAATVVPGSLSSALPFVTLADLKIRPTAPVLVADFTLKNGNDFAIKDVLVSCETFGGSGTKLGTLSKRVYEVVPGNGGKKVRELTIGIMDQQAKSARCEVAHFVRG